MPPPTHRCAACGRYSAALALFVLLVTLTWTVVAEWDTNTIGTLAGALLLEMLVMAGLAAVAFRVHDVWRGEHRVQSGPAAGKAKAAPDV